MRISLLTPAFAGRVAGWVGVLLCLGLPFTASSVAEGEHAAEGAASSTPANAHAAPAVRLEPRVETCLTDPSVVEEMRKRREELDLREKALSQKEGEITARAKAMEEELKRMEAVRDDMAKIDLSRKKENEERIAKLVETISLMSPKAASQLVSSLEEGLAVSTLSKMDNQKLAKVLNLMEPAKASRLSELLAGVVRARSKASLSQPKPDKSETAAVPASAEKGGNNHGANNNTDHESRNQSVSGNSSQSVQG